MHDLKIYICIEDSKTKQDVSIKGNFEILRAFLSVVGRFGVETYLSPLLAPLIDDPKQEGNHVAN